MKKHLTTAFLILVLILGVAVLMYPTAAEYWNSFHQTRAIANYVEMMDQADTVDYSDEWARIRSYNVSLLTRMNRMILSDEDRAEYESLLDPLGTGIMGYIEIPRINCQLSIYHGTSDAVLQIAVGHIEGTSLPGGGIGTHTVLSGHRGLPSARLFSDLDQLEIGDRFVMRILDAIVTYEVDQILIVEPTDVTALAIEPDQDLCTLVTCTPYAINTHRLLVRGHRVENDELEKVIRVVADARQIDPIIVMPCVALPILLALFVIMMVRTGKRRI